MNIFAVVGIVTLSLLAIKPISNQVLAQTNETSTQQAGKCSSDLNIQAEVEATAVQRGPNGPTTPVAIHGALTCAGQGIGGATINIKSSQVNCGTAFGHIAMTDGNGGFDVSPPVSLRPCPTPYTIEAHFAGDSANEPSAAGATFYISEKMSGGPTTNQTH